MIKVAGTDSSGAGRPLPLTAVFFSADGTELGVSCCCSADWVVVCPVLKTLGFFFVMICLANACAKPLLMQINLDKNRVWCSSILERVSVEPRELNSTKCLGAGQSIAVALLLLSDACLKTKRKNC